MIFDELKLPRHAENEASARGRNGLFDPRLIHIIGYEDNSSVSVAVNIFSRRLDGDPPIRLRLPIDEWKTLMRLVKRKVREVE